MARPKIPLISRRNALQAALKIIDNEGLDALSIRRLADELGVNGASLYHHFANKEEIVVGAAELALADVRTPETTDEDWRTWLPRNAWLLRQAVLDHPELVPVIVRKGELGMGAEMMDSSAARLVDEGVPIGAVVPLLDALEILAIGSAIHETRGGGDDATGTVADRAKTWARAHKERLLSEDELFDIASAAIVESVEVAAEAKLRAKPTRKRTAAAKKAPAPARARRAPAKASR
ncbi:MAG TPA: helix-turn-helix domain-containing protein [Jatrophihabitantaceae bacterium]|nr:helix-turn-helix domain-containing protein [Jatrophihabitantaceae bacterium]